MIPNSFTSEDQNLKKKQRSRSETISEGHPLSQIQWSKNNSANCSAVMVDWHGMNLMSVLRWSLIVAKKSHPLSSGKVPMESMATDTKQPSGIERGWRGPEAQEVSDLLRWHSLHPGMYTFSRSVCMLGQ